MIHMMVLVFVTTSTLQTQRVDTYLRLKNNAAQKGAKVFNLGTGIGYSVLDLVKAFISENGVDIPYKIAPRRAGDIATCYADASKAKEVLGWVAEKNLNDMVRDSWNWQKKNPEGYQKYFLIPLKKELKELLWSCYYGRNGRIPA